jgi:hypothetical protein
LFCVRPFEPGKGDILSLYNAGEIRWLTQKKEIPSTFGNIELTENEDGNQDINWNNNDEPALTLSEEEMENDPDIDSEEKEKKRQERVERAAANAIPAQQRTYEMPPSDDSDSDVGGSDNESGSASDREVEVNEENAEEILQNL